MPTAECFFSDSSLTNLRLMVDCWNGMQSEKITRENVRKVRRLGPTEKNEHRKESFTTKFKLPIDIAICLGNLWGAEFEALILRRRKILKNNDRHQINYVSFEENYWGGPQFWKKIRIVCREGEGKE